MKNILYLGPYRQKDGWGQAGYNYLQSIVYATQKLGYQLKTAPVYFTGQVWDSLKSTEDPTPHLSVFENTDISNFDTIIQQGLPESLWYVPDTNNVCITLLETQNMQHTKNKHILNRFDQILVPSRQEKTTLEKAGVKTAVSDILIPIDCNEIDEYVAQNKPLSSRYNDYVKFYFVGEFVPRKNIIDLIMAFSIAFRSTDKAVLFVKTSSSVSVEYINSVLKDQLVGLKHAQLNKNIVFLNKRIPRSDLLGLHHMCDVFVCPSHGEAFCIPLAEGMRFGNIPVVVENTGTTSFVNEDNGYIIPARPEICHSDDGSATLDTYSSNETWMHPTVYDISQSLKKVFHDMKNNKELMAKKKQLCHSATDLFKFEAIGEKLCSLEIM